MAFLTGLGILSALVATGSTLKCEVCYAEDMNCTSSSQSCNKQHEHEACQTTVTEQNYRGNMTLIFEKSCVLYPSACNTSYSFSTQNSSVRFQSWCCNAENCNTDPTILPQKNTTKNGVTCPVCELAFSNECDSKGQTMECSGEEIKCINFAGAVHQAGGSIIHLAFQGCITRRPCETKIKPYPDSQFEEGFTFNCTSGISTSTYLS
ncbi:phospholipase A2 inhibitor and Ly6/PLAUR domain-containing protein-like [Rhinatrema bivittatum]|uniref:phospholipase A2 inhibitor and Ly6/PLAUR domain-containing protein-like n=1 Tax=Rhinatrema bivittatum TaxID=194408 RepID=UPI0011279120|nr:phospholipase A2 inhibitor and Ly6/PLAUR domain-containing protein-like [Rhinatrema bivittatum]